jgi:Protein of unknown function (DUF1569)
MNRRQFLIAQSLVLACPGLAFADSTRKVRSLSGALDWLDTLAKSAAPRSTGVWPLAAVLEHLAQSVEMSMTGFPEPTSVLFQNTVGAAAFAIFKWRGKMSHALNDAIPGAPGLTMTESWQASALRLQKAIVAFESFSGALKPHFAYGNLNKRDFAQAHVLHIANHQDDIVVSALA